MTLFNNISISAICANVSCSEIGLQPVFGFTPFSFINLIISSMDAFDPFIFQFPPTKNFRPDIFVSYKNEELNCEYELFLW